MATAGTVLRLTQTGKTSQSLLLTDIEDHNRRMGNQDKGSALPVYVPAGSYVDLPFGGIVTESYQSGSIYKFINAGYLTAEFQVEDELAEAVATAAYDAGDIYYPPTTHGSEHLPGGNDPIPGLGGGGPHASNHEDGGSDEITAQNLSVGAAADGQWLESSGGGLTLVPKNTDLRDKTIGRDGAGLIQTITYDGSDVWTISRDGDGLISSISNGTHTKTIGRDAEGRIQSVTVT